MRTIGAGRLSAWTAHALAWAAGAWFALGPVYQGESVAAAIPGEPAGEITRSSATLVEANGLHVLLLLLVPILLTAVAILAIQFTKRRGIRRKVLLWGPAVVLLGFCVVSIFSIGLFYLPAALALLVAAFIDLDGQEANV